jgi:hypothetical protein
MIGAKMINDIGQRSVTYAIAALEGKPQEDDDRAADNTLKPRNESETIEINANLPTGVLSGRLNRAMSIVAEADEAQGLDTKASTAVQDRSVIALAYIGTCVNVLDQDYSTQQFALSYRELESVAENVMRYEDTVEMGAQEAEQFVRRSQETTDAIALAREAFIVASMEDQMR